MRTIREEWERFEAACIPSSAGDVQRQEMRRAFFAGAHALLCMLNELGGDDVSDQAGAAVIHGLHDECALFAKQIQRGEA